jgi:hypothetical protein
MDRYRTNLSSTFATEAGRQTAGNVAVKVTKHLIAGLEFARAHLLRLSGAMPAGLLSRPSLRLQPALVPAVPKTPTAEPSCSAGPGLRRRWRRLGPGSGTRPQK